VTGQRVHTHLSKVVVASGTSFPIIPYNGALRGTAREGRHPSKEGRSTLHPAL